MQQVNRIEPAMPVQSYKTYEIRAPRSTHFRPASCMEFGCLAHRNGWATLIDPSTPLGEQQAYYIRKQSGRKYVEESLGPNALRFTFEAGQRCFAKHEVPIGKPELFVVRDGDWRGNPTGRVRRHVQATDWVDDFAEHQIRVAEQVQRG
jgi:hypothetical protein